MSIIKGIIRGSKDIANIIDTAKAEVIDLYRHHNALTSIDISIYIDDESLPTIECKYKEYVEDG